MNFGFNSNVRVGDAVYHVQTEDRGPSHPFLDTVVYVAGRVVHKRSTSYQDLTGGTEQGEALAKHLHERLSRQHHEVMAQLEAGTLQLHGPGGPPAKVAPAASIEGLEIHLLNPKSWLASGNATLEIELRQKGSATALDEAETVAFLEGEQDRATSSHARTDEKGRATLRFPMPGTIAEGTALVIRATTGVLHGELRFLLKAKSGEKTPTPSAK
jgi:hypothetical protein